MLRWLTWIVFLPLLLPIAALRALLALLRPCTVLQLRIHGALADVSPASRGGSSLLGLVRALEHAATDPKLRLVSVHLEHASLGLAQAEELRAALLRVKNSGKQVTLSAETLGLAGYWLALGASKLILSPNGSLDVAGVASEFTLLRGLLDKVGVRARMLAKGRYKSMREMFTEHEISAENREMLTALVADLYEQLIERVAAARALSPADVKARIDEGPFRASEALRLGLIDELAYQEDLDAALRDDPSSRPLGAAGYLRRKERRFFPTRPPLIGVLEVRGNITSGKDGVGLGGGRSTGSVTFLEQVRRAKENPRIKALLLRVSSPGGSALASDLMWHALCGAKAKKPIVVSMGDVAASGGYYVSGIAGAQILASPTTLTGSIGVVAGKWEADGLMHKLGVRRDLVHMGKHAAYYSPTVPWGDSEEEKLARDVDALYVDFVSKMASARSKSFDAFEPLARGRVWTGSQAVQNGLVDASGGLYEATVHLKRALGLDAEAQLGFAALASARRWRVLLDRITAAGVSFGGFSFGPASVSAHTEQQGLGEFVRLRLPFDIRFK